MKYNFPRQVSSVKMLVSLDFTMGKRKFSFNHSHSGLYLSSHMDWRKKKDYINFR